MCRLLHDGLEYWRRNAPDRLAVAIDDARTALTFEELGAWSDGIGERLSKRGVRPGDNVAITGATTLAWIAAAFGILKAGAAIVPYNTHLSDDDLAFLIDRAEPRLILADEVQARRIAGLLPEAPVLPKTTLSTCRAGASATWRRVEVAPDALAMIIFTSGSTGRPKGVMVSHDRQLSKYLELLVAEPTLGKDSRLFMPLPLHAAAGTQWGFMLTTNIGASGFFSSGFDPERALDTLVTERITAFMAISLYYDQIARCAGFAAADLSAISFAQAGGMRLARTTLSAWRDKGPIIRQVYGLTEIGGIGLMPTNEEALARPDACGRGMVHSSVRTVRPDDSPAAANEPGDVLIQSPGMMLGYWHDPEASAAAIADGWMQTGDVGIIDEQGYFTFMDRRKDMIGEGAMRVSPSEVEIAIASLDEVSEAAVGMVPDAAGAPSICAWVHLSAPLTAEAISNHIRGRLAAHKVPGRIILLDAPLPRMLSGKVDRPALLRQTQPQPLHAV